MLCSLRSLALMLLILAFVSTLSAFEQDQALPVGDFTTVSISHNTPAAFSFVANQAGALSIIARAADLDIKFSVQNSQGMTIPGSETDIDYGGDTGAEHAVVIIPRAGTYRVLIELTMGLGSGQVTVGASWLPYPGLAPALFPHSEPDTAVALALGEQHQGTIQGGGPQRHYWYALHSNQAGQVVLATRAPEGDLKIEVYRANNFARPETTVDNDENGVRGNETATVQVVANETVYFRVVAWGHGMNIPFEVRTAFLNL